MVAFDQAKKNSYKFKCYLKGLLNDAIPKAYWRHSLDKILRKYESLDSHDKQEIMGRVNYYNKLTGVFSFPEKLNFHHQKYQGVTSQAYMMDFKYLMNFFPENMNFSYLFGDIVDVPDFPTFLKSRPIFENQKNENSILLKLNKIRHYYVIRDKYAFEQKIPKLVWRGKSNQPERVELLKRFYNSQVCDVGDTHYKSKRTVYEKPFMSIPEQLQYRYVLSIEGKDVATNLKWIMASSSVCFMRKPRFETWFMEGTLKPDYHFVLLKDDHSDLEEKVDYYNQHPQEAQKIVENANRYVNQFFNEERELMVSLLVIKKYFELSKQL